MANSQRHRKWCPQKLDIVQFNFMGGLEEVLIMMQCKMVNALATMTYMVGADLYGLHPMDERVFHDFNKQ